ncbi:MAG: PSD1 domain-containing protein [Verrucomicrobiaceae bacterium]|nr:PSD1 domain-containing protein [Verrucomicrobiaceae bacterium]
MKPPASIAAFFMSGIALSTAAALPSADQIAFFEKNIRPILIQRCYECHSTEKGKSKGGLTLDSREGILKGGDNGPALIAGDPEKSRLIESVRYKNQDMQMPPKGALPSSEVRLLEEWVQMGAPDPREAVAAKSSAPRVINIAEGAKHWAFRPMASPKTPGAAGGNPIDAFISEKLAEKGLALSSPADPRTLIRRITFDLTGLPPTPEEVKAFLAERIKNPESAIRNLIDRLLASPHYGEKWGRHWLDVARYADSNGLDENIALGTAWRYRDYVVQAINNDLPFDQFLTEQIAGDLLESKDVPTRQRRMTATAFLNLGAKVLAEPDKEKLTMDVVDEQIDVMGRAFMGLTLGCARCHDHKFDPVGQDDYYALAAIFKSTQSFSVDRIGALSTAYESPMGDFEAFATIKSAERVLKEQKEAVSKAEAAANKALKDEIRAKAVDYLMAAASVPPTPTLSQVRPIAEKHGLRPHILLNTRVWLAANESHLFFKPWQEAVRTKKDASHLRPYFTLIFAQAEKITPPQKGSVSASLLHQARAALDDAKGFLALPPEPMVLYTKDVAEKVQSLRDTMMATESNLPDLPTAISVSDAPKILKELPVHIRGSHLALGKPVARGVPQVMQVSMKSKPAFPEKQSGRLELARWLSSPEHPLTARVMVNRVWTWHFNQGLVPTPDNFGLLGTAPTHPELLDYLSRWFIANGWSLKAMHRLILTSRTYQQASSTIGTRAAEVDPENKLLYRFPIRRLEAEEVRDALLAVAGSLDPSIGGKTIPRRNREFVFNHTSKDFTTYGSTRRALYLPIIRNNLYDLFQQFDYPDPATSTGQRNSTVVSPQALLLMNSDLVTRAADTLSSRLLKIDADLRLATAWRLAYAREATEADLRRARDFLTTADASLASTVSDPKARERQTWSLLAQALLMSSEFVYLR